ncbi:hypothetical protein C1Y11_04235 [Pseudomonas sp. FW305-20]|nr:hypothetical protein C1Y11_04235 [Pseudomonas sp. FW305-20]PMU43207.1 hypothetical protein C1Y12_03290 [Pseudomonas sp. FW305-47B]PMX64533.1 hypothetical protein C1Y13_04085 [Pseudomonas sp. FW305-33]
MLSFRGRLLGRVRSFFLSQGQPWELMWRGGLPPLGCEAPQISFTTASQSNGGKPPRHKAHSHR